MLASKTADDQGVWIIEYRHMNKNSQTSLDIDVIQTSKTKKNRG